MRTTLCLILAVAGCGGGDGMPDPIDEEPPGLVGITQAHNQVRASVGAGLPDLVWDGQLAAIAQGWADDCVDNDPPAGLVDHNDNRSDTYPEYVGENIFGSSATATGTQAVNSWASEAAFYDYASNTCNPPPTGGSCGHYTQLVWRTTTKVGCGISDCSGLMYRSTIVCDYAPGGNSGGRPY